MADRFLEGDATRNALAHENVAGMEIGVEEIVDEQHVEEAKAKRFAVLDASQPVERVTQDLFRVLEERLPELFEA